MNKDFSISVSTGHFRKIRELNRRRNYFMKEVKTNIKLYIAKLLWDKRKKNVLDINSIRNILLLRNEGTIGDMVVCSPLVKALYEAGYNIDVLLTESSSEVMKYNPYVRNIYTAVDVSTEVYLKDFNHSVPSSTIKTLKENKYELVIDPAVADTPIHRIRLLKDINAKSVLGFNKWRNINHYSRSLPFKDEKAHVTQSVALLSEGLGINPMVLSSYSIHIPNFILDEVKMYLSTLEKKNKVIVNMFTGSKERCFSPEQLLDIVHGLKDMYVDIEIILLDHHNQIKISLPKNVVINPFKTLHHVMALIHEVDLIISPDTSIVHIAAAWEKPLIAVYKDVVDNNYLWAPGYDNASQIIVHHRSISHVENIPDLILQEIKRRGLLDCE